MGIKKQPVECQACEQEGCLYTSQLSTGGETQKYSCVYLKRRIRSGKDMLLSESSLFTNGSALLTTRKYSL